MTTTQAEPIALDYFSGGVPTGEYFRITLDEIREISESDPNHREGINRLQELCFIGILSYFEAFCKDQFAAIVNIEPALVNNLKASGQDIAIDAAHVAMYGSECNRRIGFLLASKYDFGTPQKVNALYASLLKITPFGKQETRQFERFLLDRNLLVHHGGTFTLRYLEQSQMGQSNLTENAFMNSRTVRRNEVALALNFFEDIARKLVRASHDALVKYIDHSGLQYLPEQKKAMGFLLCWSDLVD
jgi:hypothetical protein